jgi:hypothetical protein
MRRICLCLIFLIALIAELETSALSDNPAAVIRLGFTSKVVNIADRNDATIAIKAWATTVAKEQELNEHFEVSVMETEEELSSAFSHGLIDAATITSEQLLDLSLNFSNVYITMRGDSPSIRYALLVRKDNINSLEQLDPQSVTIFRGQEMTLAKMWVSGLFAESFQAQSKIISPLNFPQEGNISQIIFKVFFQQIDAAVVPIDAFMLAAELNPQLTKELLILRQSEPLIPGLFVFRPTWDGPARDALEIAITQLHKTPTGQQVLTVFQCSCIKKYPMEIMDETYDFITRHKALGIQP